MRLLMLPAARGTEISVETAGAQALDLIEALDQLVQNRFGEDF
jgi:phosphocarrier protein